MDDLIAMTRESKSLKRTDHHLNPPRCYWPAINLDDLHFNGKKSEEKRANVKVVVAV